jgi:hypothetical protein
MFDEGELCVDSSLFETSTVSLRRNVYIMISVKLVWRFPRRVRQPSFFHHVGVPYNHPHVRIRDILHDRMRTREVLHALSDDGSIWLVLMNDAEAFQHGNRLVIERLYVDKGDSLELTGITVS